MSVLSVLDSTQLANEARPDIIKKRFMPFAKTPPGVGLSCKLVPVSYREHEYELLFGGIL